MFAQLENDQVILALPDTFLEVLPKNAFAFRDLEVLSLNPADIRKLTITRGVRIDELESDKNGEPNQWKMLRPTSARADARSVTLALAALSKLRADQFVADSVDDLYKFGLDHPILEIAWESDKAHRLMIGSQVPRTPAYYARTNYQQFVFTVKTEVLRPFEADFPIIPCSHFQPRKLKGSCAPGVGPNGMLHSASGASRQEPAGMGQVSPAPTHPGLTSRGLTPL